MSTEMASSKLVGGGTSYVKAGTIMMHKTTHPRLDLTNNRNLYCTRTGDNEFPVKGDYRYYFETTRDLRFFRWGGHSDPKGYSRSLFNQEDMNEFMKLLESSKGTMAEDNYEDIEKLLVHPSADRMDVVEPDRSGAFTFSYTGDSDFSDAVGPLFKMHGYAGWVRDTESLTEYMFIRPADDLKKIMVTKKNASYVEPPASARPAARPAAQPPVARADPDDDAGVLPDEGSGLPDRGRMFHDGLNRRAKSRLRGGMMTTQRFFDARKVIKKNSCNSIAGAFLSHNASYKNSKERDALKKLFTEEGCTIGETREIQQERFGRPRRYAQIEEINYSLDHHMKYAQSHGLIGDLTIGYWNIDNPNGWDFEHIIAFVTETMEGPNKGLLAFFDPEQTDKQYDAPGKNLVYVNAFDGKWSGPRLLGALGYKELGHADDAKKGWVVEEIAVHDRKSELQEGIADPETGHLEPKPAEDYDDFVKR